MLLKRIWRPIRKINRFGRKPSAAVSEIDSSELDLFSLCNSLVPMFFRQLAENNLFVTFNVHVHQNSAASRILHRVLFK